MIRRWLIFPLLACVCLVSFLLPKTVFASEHKVKAVILVPANWKDRFTPDKEARYKAGIIDALKATQNWYSERLRGKTFKFDPNVQVIYSSKNISLNYENYSNFVNLDGHNLIPPDQKTIFSVWIVGSENSKEQGGGSEVFNNTAGLAFLNHQSLLQNSSSNTYERYYAFGTLAHELGHTFNLVNAGFAKWHPCSEISKHECLDNAPQPLPNSTEYELTIVGAGSIFFPSAYINNSIHNPEVAKAFKSPFLNPTSDSPPKPVSASQTPKISSIVKENAIIGSEVEIKGTNFGNTKSKIILKGGTSLQYGTNRKDTIEIKDFNLWSSNLIKFIVPQEASKNQHLGTLWQLEVVTSDGSIGTYFAQFIVQEPQRELPPLNLSVAVKVTCGDNQNKQPSPNQQIRLYWAGATYSSPLTSSKTNDQGEAQISLTVDKLYTTTPIIVLPTLIYGIAPIEPRMYDIKIPQSASNSQSFSDSINFNYPQCPTKEAEILTEQAKKQIKEVVTPVQEESERIVTKLDLDSLEAIRVVISNYESFQSTNDDNNQGSTTTTFDYTQGKTIDWTTSTHLGNPKVHVQIIYQNKSPENYSIEVDTKETKTNIGKMELVIKRPPPKVTSEAAKEGEQPAQDTASVRQITKIYLATVSGDYMVDLYDNGEYLDPEIDITDKNSQFKIIRCFSDLSCDDPNFAKVVNLAVETSKAARQSDQSDQPIQEEPTKQPPVEQPSEEAPLPQQPTFSHRTCGDVSGNVIVDVYSDGSEVAGTNCEDLDKVCQVFDSEGTQDATCVDTQSLE